MLCFPNNGKCKIIMSSPFGINFQLKGTPKRRPCYRVSLCNCDVFDGFRLYRRAVSRNGRMASFDSLAFDPLIF